MWAGFRLVGAFLYGVILGVLWEAASMGILVLATLTEYAFGTLVMLAIFLTIAYLAWSVASRADLGQPLIGILAFRLVAQGMMTVNINQLRRERETLPALRPHRPPACAQFGTGSLLLTTMLHDTPACTSSRIRSNGWRRPLVWLLKPLQPLLPTAWMRRAFGVEPPFGPPFLRLLAAIFSEEALGWLPSFGLPSLLGLPGTIAFTPVDAASDSAWHLSGDEDLIAWAAELGGRPIGPPVVYTYSCRDVVHDDYNYVFRYSAFWMQRAPSSFAFARAAGSLAAKMLLMHAFASLFMLLSQVGSRTSSASCVQPPCDRPVQPSCNRRAAAPWPPCTQHVQPPRPTMRPLAYPLAVHLPRCLHSGALTTRRPPPPLCLAAARGPSARACAWGLGRRS